MALPTPSASRLRARHRRRRAVALSLAVAIVAAIVVRAATVAVPPVSVQAASARTVRLPGPAPRPAWPSAGQAALSVRGIGTLGSSGGQAPRPIASLTKVMTAYLTLRRYPLGPTGNGFVLTVTRADQLAEARDVDQDQSVVRVRAGEQLDERQLLEALLIPSGDNIARMLARYEAGSVAAFVAEMNREARALALHATTYVGPSGFAPGTVSTASDQLRLFKRALHLVAFRQIIALASVTLPVAGTVENFNPLIADGYFGKTGSDSAAGGCLAFFRDLTVAGHRVTVTGVVLGQGEGADTAVILGAAASATRRLVDSVVPAIRARTVVPAGTAVIRLRAAGGGQTAGVTARVLRAVGWGGLAERVSITPDPVGSATIGAGARVGHIALAGPLPSVPAGPGRTTVRAAGALSGPGFLWRLGHLL